MELPLVEKQTLHKYTMAENALSSFSKIPHKECNAIISNYMLSSASALGRKTSFTFVPSVCSLRLKTLMVTGLVWMFGWRSQLWERRQNIWSVPALTELTILQERWMLTQGETEGENYKLIAGEWLNHAAQAPCYWRQTNDGSLWTGLDP